tara:strand:+ start:4055 stop:4546 length:492 start_codon:yes stop_codon:yes gene_type:complete
MPKETKVKKHVDWCLRKAKKEMDEGKDHKGLVKISPDKDLALDHIEKAEHNLKAFIHNLHDFSDVSETLGFYAAYHCCLSIIAKYGYESKNQECTFSIIKLLIENEEIDNNLLDYITRLENQVRTDREGSQYSPVLEVSTNKTQDLLELCQEMLNITRGIVKS